mmetsp:Transcript_71275/g.200704  ORF Transcript_71275/g.200704 Transcript_71275/m.200704 type:complete len:447 (-) Transcript_71275:2398-3738(-)
MFGGTQLGFAMGQMGWFWGTFWLLFSGLATWISGHLLGRLCINHHCDTYPELGEKAFGRAGRNMVTACQWFGYFFVGVVQVAALGSSYVQTFADVPALNSICQNAFMIIGALVLVPFLQIPSFTGFGQLALFSASIAVFGTFIYLGEIARNGKYTDVCYDQYTAPSIMANIANMAFTYGGHGTFPEQVREMKDPNDFFRGFDILYGVAMPFYTVCALVSFWAFGNMNSANYIENLMDNNIVKVNLYLSLLSGLPIIVLGQVVILLQLEIPAGILPTDWWVNRSQNEGQLATFLRSTKLSPVMIRFFFRTFYIGVLLLLAEMLDDAGLGTIVSISGAIGLAAMTYWLPFVLALKLDWEEVRMAHHCESRNVSFFSPNHISPFPVQEQAGPGRMVQPPCVRWHFHQRDGRSIQRDRPGRGLVSIIHRGQLPRKCRILGQRHVEEHRPR